MLPRIGKIESGRVQINGAPVEDNFFLHNEGFELLEKSAKISKKDFERVALREPEIAVFGIGFLGKIKIDDAVLAAAKKQKIAVHVLPSEAAIKKFQDFARRGKKVVAHIHVGE
ncbi:MAG TPA: MTH938/NDUFAF3 family protein [archaeon]|nr:MTH938/NDUFAF3 family protein [archaeon]